MNIKGWVLTAATAMLLVGCSGNENNTPQLDQWTPSQCWAADAGLMPRVFSSKFNPGQHAWVGAGYRTLVLQRLSDGLPVVFTREPFLPKHCTQKPESGAQQVVDTLAELLQQFHHGLSQTALLRWQYEAQRIDAIESDVPFDDQVALFALVGEVLEDSNDEHALKWGRRNVSKRGGSCCKTCKPADSTMDVNKPYGGVYSIPGNITLVYNGCIALALKPVIVNLDSVACSVPCIA